MACCCCACASFAFWSTTPINCWPSRYFETHRSILRKQACWLARFDKAVHWALDSCLQEKSIPFRLHLPVHVISPSDKSWSRCLREAHFWKQDDAILLKRSVYISISVLAVQQETQKNRCELWFYPQDSKLIGAHTSKDWLWTLRLLFLTSTEKVHGISTWSLCESGCKSLLKTCTLSNLIYVLLWLQLAPRVATTRPSRWNGQMQGGRSNESSSAGLRSEWVSRVVRSPRSNNTTVKTKTLTVARERLLWHFGRCLCKLGWRHHPPIINLHHRSCTFSNNAEF